MRLHGLVHVEFPKVGRVRTRATHAVATPMFGYCIRYFLCVFDRVLVQKHFKLIFCLFIAFDNNCVVEFISFQRRNTLYRYVDYLRLTKIH